MSIIKNFVVTSKDMSKIVNRGCRICKNKSFRFTRNRCAMICSNCKTRYVSVPDEFINLLSMRENNFTVYRSGDIYNEDEEFDIKTMKSNYSLRKLKVSER